MRRFAIALGFAWLAGCAPKASTLPSLSVGQTGCTQEQLTLFNYRPKERTWTAVCQEKIFACSARGGLRCALSSMATTQPLLHQRAARLQELPYPRRAYFVTEDVMAYDQASFDRLLAVTHLASDAALKEASGPSGLMILPDQDARQLAACTTEPVQFKVRGNRFKLLAKNAGLVLVLCIGGIQRGLEATPAQIRLQKAVAWSEGSESNVSAWIAAHAATPIASADSSLTASDATPAAPAAAQPADPASDQEVRALLDAHAIDLLACVGTPRVVIEASVNGEHAVAFAVRGMAASDPIQGCVRAVLGAPQIAGGPGEVVHLVRNVEERTSAGEPSSEQVPH
jgi:hypothetical protein